MVPSTFSWTYKQASNNKKESKLITMFNPRGLASSKIGRKITLVLPQKQFDMLFLFVCLTGQASALLVESSDPALIGALQ